MHGRIHNLVECAATDHCAIIGKDYGIDAIKYRYMKRMKKPQARVSRAGKVAQSSAQNFQLSCCRA